MNADTHATPKAEESEFQAFWADIAPAVQTISNAVVRRTGAFSLRIGITTIGVLTVCVPLMIWHMLWEERASHRDSYWGGEIEAKTLLDLSTLALFLPLSIFYESRYGSFRHAFSLTLLFCILYAADLSCYSLYLPYVEKDPSSPTRRDVKDRLPFWHPPPFISLFTPIALVYMTRESVYPGFMLEKIRRARVLDYALGPVLPHVLFASGPWILFLLEWLAAPKVQLFSKIAIAIVGGYVFYFAGPYFYKIVPAQVVKGVDNSLQKMQYYVPDPDAEYEAISAPNDADAIDIEMGEAN
ncbi:hypothetical protein BC830DRAFT_1224158 [Chytriomyces sp. MP71]|nr:hypothetical protein BC830DRAFT_1224158 [Chytriomyces sp. MP71]